MVYFLLVRPKVWIQIAVLHHFISTRTSLQMQRKKYCNVTCYSLPAINEAATQITDDPGLEKSWDAERDREEVTRPSDICGWPGNDDLSPHWPGTHTLDSGRVSPGHSSWVSHKQEHWNGIKCNETMDKNWSLLPWYSATRESLLPGGNWTLRIVEILCNW